MGGRMRGMVAFWVFDLWVDHCYGFCEWEVDSMEGMVG